VRHNIAHDEALQISPKVLIFVLLCEAHYSSLPCLFSVRDFSR
jgi:hypothetical protein